MIFPAEGAIPSFQFLRPKTLESLVTFRAISGSGQHKEYGEELKHKPLHARLTTPFEGISEYNEKHSLQASAICS